MKYNSICYLLITISIISCNKPINSTEDVIRANLEATGGIVNWTSLKTLQQNYTVTTYIGGKEVSQVEKIKKIKIPSTQREETYIEKNNLEDFTLTNGTESVQVKYKDGKPFGTSTLPTSTINFKLELELLKKIDELIISDTVYNKNEVYKISDNNGNDYLYSKKTKYLVAQLSSTLYGNSITRFNNYRQVEGLIFPFSTTQDVATSGFKQTTEYSEMKINISFPPKTFDMVDDSWNKIRKGKPFPDFKLPLMNSNKFIEKSELKGKVFLIDFWATWCKPCIAEFPNIRNLYDKYNSRGFEVVSISLDENIKALDNYYEKYTLPWLNIHLEKGLKSDFAKEMQIISIPKPILVNKEGVIIATDLEASGEALKQTLNKIFKEKL